MKNTNNANPRPDLETDLQFEIVSWTQIYSALWGLAETIKNSGFEPDVIVGISRGGWIPARILSDLLENPNLATVATNFYVGIAETKLEPIITQAVSVPVKTKKVLVVDDLTDTGKSLKLVISYLKHQGASEVKTATVYHKPWSIIVPDYYEKETQLWVVFPWDQKETVRKIVEKFTANGNAVGATKEKLISSGLDKKIVEQLIKQITEEKH